MGLHFIQASRKGKKVGKDMIGKISGGPMRECIDELDDLLEMTSRAVRKKLRQAGCKEIRQKGSHVQVQCPPQGKQTTVPVHGSKDIKKGTLKGMEKSLDLDIDGDGRPPKKRKTEDVDLTEDALEEGRKKRVSVDALIQFKHKGKTVTAKMVNSVWQGNKKPMLYTWLTSNGDEVTTEGVPKDRKVLADVPSRYRK